MTDEKLKQFLGHTSHRKGDSPFKVPDGYFEDFSARVMSQLPQTPVVKRRSLLRITVRYAAAAVLVGVVSATSIWIYQQRTAPQAELAVDASLSPSQEVDDQYFEDELDYAMMSNNDIVRYLAEN